MTKKIKKVDLKKIKELRKTQNKSLEYMSEKLGYESPNGYYYLEVGRGKFSAEQLHIVADELGVPIKKLFFEKEITISANESA